MIVSHEHHYVFIEMPNTASTAIAAELTVHYRGQSILWKHATYYDFLRVCSSRERECAVFAGHRHPMDIVVSRYFKF